MGLRLFLMSMRKLLLSLMFMKKLLQLQLLLWLLLPMLAILSLTPCQLPQVLPPRQYLPQPPMPLPLQLTTLLQLRLDASTMLDLWFHVPSNCTLSYHFHLHSAHLKFILGIKFDIETYETEQIHTDFEN